MFYLYYYFRTLLYLNQFRDLLNFRITRLIHTKRNNRLIVSVDKNLVDCRRLCTNAEDLHQNFEVLLVV